MRITVLSHNLSSNAAMRAHRLALAARAFAEITLLGPVERHGLWPALPSEPWIKTVPEKRFPKFADSFFQLLNSADGDVLIAAKPHLASFGAALVEGERRGVPVILDHDDLDMAFVPRQIWPDNPPIIDPRRPASPVYISLLTKASGAAAAITVSSTALQRKFGGTLICHGVDTELFDPEKIDRAASRNEFGFDGPTVLFAGTAREHKGILPLLAAVQKISGARVAATCRENDLADPQWSKYPLSRIPFVPYNRLPRLLAAADIVVIPQLATETARYQMPMKVYDAMAMGKPIVASAVSDLPALLDGCALLVPPSDVTQLTAAIADLLRDPDKGRLLGEQARRRIKEEFSLKHVSEKLAQVVHGVADSFPKRTNDQTQ